MFSRTPSSLKCTYGMQMPFDIVCGVRWSPFNVKREHWSTLTRHTCGLRSKCVAHQIGNKGGNITQAEIRWVLGLLLRGSMGRIDGGNCFQGIYPLQRHFDVLVECDWRGCLIQHWQLGVLVQRHCPTARPFVKPM
jgi:hypothetical protein